MLERKFAAAPFASSFEASKKLFRQFRQGFRTLSPEVNGLGWSPSQSSYFDSANSLWNMSSSKFLVPRLLKRYDNKGAFELWSVVAILSYLAVSQSWRPAGASMLRRAVQYAIPAILVTHPWGEVCSNSIRAMVIVSPTRLQHRPG